VSDTDRNMAPATSARDVVSPRLRFWPYAVRYVPVYGLFVRRGGRTAVQSRPLALRRSAATPRLPASTRTQIQIELLEAVDVVAQAVGIERSSTRLLGEGCPATTCRRGAVARRRQGRARAVRPDDDAGIADDGTVLPRIGGDHRAPHAHRLEQGQRKSLRRRWEDEDIGRTQQVDTLIDIRDDTSRRIWRWSLASRWSWRRCVPPPAIRAGGPLPSLGRGTSAPAVVPASRRQAVPCTHDELSI